VSISNYFLKLSSFLLLVITIIMTDVSFSVEASELYLHVKFTTIDEFLKRNIDCTPFYLNQPIPENT